MDQVSNFAKCSKKRYTGALSIRSLNSTEAFADARNGSREDNCTNPKIEQVW